MNIALRRNLAFIRKYVAPPESASPEDILPPFEVAKLLRDEAYCIDTDQADGATEISEMLSRHHKAVTAAWRTGGAPVPMTVESADAAALEASELDSEDGIDY